MEAAGIPADLIEHAYKLHNEKQQAISALTTTHEGQQAHEATNREKQLTIQAFEKLKAEGAIENEPNRDATENIMGISSLHTLQSIHTLGERLFYYIQADVPDLKRVAERMGEQRQERDNDAEAEELRMLTALDREQQQVKTGEEVFQQNQHNQSEKQENPYAEHARELETQKKTPQALEACL
jgi:hypothetical protein